MKLKYDGKYFIGAIKFYDRIKGFGFIASNKCGMPDKLLYAQDFYINSSSFASGSPIEEGAVVVFQIEQQDRGRLRAINLRRVSRDENDVELAMTYYGDYETVEINTSSRYNIYTKCYKPHGRVAKHVIDLIENEESRTPQKTLEHFNFFIKHYGSKKTDEGELYVFDTDFNKEDKIVWEHFFDSLTTLEITEILKKYPSVIKYIKDPEIVDKWIDSAFSEQLSLEAMNQYQKMSTLLPMEKQNVFLTKLSSCIDKKIESLFEEISADKDFWKGIKIDDRLSWNARYRLSNLYSKRTEKDWLDSRIKPYLKLTQTNHDVEYETCLNTIRRNKYESLLKDFLAKPNENNLNSLIKTIDTLSEVDKEQKTAELEETILNSIKYLSKLEHLNVAFSIYEETHYSDEFTNQVIEYFSPYTTSYFSKWASFDDTSRINLYFEQLKKFSPLIKKKDMADICKRCVDKLCQCKTILAYRIFFNSLSIFNESYNSELQAKVSHALSELLISTSSNSINSKYEFSEFFKSFDEFSIKLNDRDKNTIIEKIQSIIDTSNSVSILLEFYQHNFFIVGLPNNYLLERIKLIVSKWQYVDFSNCFYEPDELFENHKDIKEFVARSGIDLISNYKLSEDFSGKTKTYSFRSIESSNCSYLKNIRKFIGFNVTFEPFDNYINSRSAEEQLILFDNGVIDKLPTSIYKNIIDSITVNDVEAPSIRWYNPPKLKNQLYIKVLSSADNLFDIIEERLSSIPFDYVKDNVILSVILTELLSINKPKELTQQWLSEFTSKIIALSNRHPENRMLQIVLWAVYLKTEPRLGPINDIFPYLPPYLQIKLVKWFFYAKATGKKDFTALGLAQQLGTGHSYSCFAVAIALEYLVLREGNPQATLTHYEMLRLLRDREDHSEWVGIRHFVHDCVGRYIRDYNNDTDRWGRPKERWRFYNGIAFKKDGKIVVFVPRRLVNQNGEQQMYPNPGYNSICQYIKLAFSNIGVSQTDRGVYFFLSEDYDLQIRSLVRIYNLRYGNLHDEIIKTTLNSNEYEIQNFCECRLSERPDSNTEMPFYWCGNKPCFRDPVRYHLDSEWSQYTILDFMRILNIPTDYTNKQGKTTRFGYYIFFSSYLRSFAKFYEHLKCRGCGKLMKPLNMSNFATRAVTEFACKNEQCHCFNKTVYLNHCFNTLKCDTTIDSRDSKQCPNGQYICPECGACCSTQNFSNRLRNLHLTGGFISPWLENFVHNDLGHWEKNIYYCYKCGSQMVDGQCPICHIRYKQK